MQDNSYYDDTHLMGIDPHMSFYDLNLAGAQGIPTADSIAHATIQPVANAPTFTSPTTNEPTLAPYDLIEPGINLRPASTADPLLPDLSEYAHPYGLDIQPNAASDLAQPGLLIDEHPNTRDNTRDIWQPDPLQPDLQHPDLTQQTHMQQRPGDLDTQALDVMYQSLTYQQLDAKTYPSVFMDQAGINTTRSRHMDLLMRGLDEES